MSGQRAMDCKNTWFFVSNEVLWPPYLLAKGQTKQRTGLAFERIPDISRVNITPRDPKRTLISNYLR